jgi:hypothetical protein
MQLAAIRVDDDADDHDLHPDHDGGERDVALDAAALALGNTCRPSDPPTRGGFGGPTAPAVERLRFADWLDALPA